MIRGSHQILIGDNRTTLKQVAPGSVQCAITSPPYFRQRSYLPKGHPDKKLEIGSEQTIEEYVANLVGVFDLVRDTLHETGTLWVNLGDSYASGKGSCFNPGGGKESFKNRAKELFGLPLHRLNKSDIEAMGLKPGDQMLVPHRFAFAMQAAGWYLRLSGVKNRLCQVRFQVGVG